MSLDEICTVLDKLTIDTLTLIEEDIQMKINLENAMCIGESHLAKSRYILGQNSVSSIQLPTENSPEFEATVVVTKQADEQNEDVDLRELEVLKNDNQTDPVRWFGYLVPQDLYHAQKMFKQALHWVIGAANVEAQLIEHYEKIEQLKELKASISAK